MDKLISRKKNIYPVEPVLDKYLKEFSRTFRMPISYQDLLGFSDSFALYDGQGNDTLWSSVSYDRSLGDDIHDGLLGMYAFMRFDGDFSMARDLLVDRVDLCLYGNTKPFRIRIINKLNDNFEYFYVKEADASRIFGLELEHILSPNRIGFFYDRDTLVEEHIYGIAGDVFINKYIDNPDFNMVRLSKEFVKFNERCLIRLLGDMHCSNFVINIVMDTEMNFYRIQAIDFDQQCYESKLRVYLPQFFKQNRPLVELVLRTLPPESIRQYQNEERTLINKRILSSTYRLESLIRAMVDSKIAPLENVEELGRQLAKHYDNPLFASCKSMGALLELSLRENERHKR